MVKVRSIFLFICCLLVAVGPLNFLQVVAWGNMIHDYSEDRSIAEAAEMTFSGEYPCEMCRRIAEAKAQTSEGDQETPFPVDDRTSIRLVFSYQENILDPTTDWAPITFSLRGNSAMLAPLQRFQRVPTPPPQFVSC